MAEMIEPSDLSLPPSAEPPTELRPPLPPEPARERRGGVAAVLPLLCLLALAVGGFWVWRSVHALGQRLQQVERAQQAADPNTVSQLGEQVTALRATVAKLQATPEPAAAAPSSPQPPQVELKPLEDRIAALEQRPAATVPDQSALTGKVQGLLGQLDSLAQQVQAAQAAAKTAQEQAATANDQAKTSQDQAKAAEERAKAAQDQAKAAQGQASSAAAQTAAVTDRAGQAQQLQVATTALDEGRPLGDIAGAPPALTRFATTPPPTEAALRLAFPPLAKQAAEASRPSLEGESLATRMWTRAQSLVTVKQGNRVLVGAPATTTLSQAQALLDAGDLPGALHALSALDPAAAQVMAPWRERAQSLIEARTALAATASALAHR